MRPTVNYLRHPRTTNKRQVIMYKRNCGHKWNGLVVSLIWILRVTFAFQRCAILVSGNIAGKDTTTAQFRKMKSSRRNGVRFGWDSNPLSTGTWIRSEQIVVARWKSVWRVRISWVWMHRAMKMLILLPLWPCSIQYSDRKINYISNVPNTILNRLPKSRG
mgnify:CR=1 FL=1